MPTPSLFPFRHDWAAPFRVTRAAATDIQHAFDGSEVRVQLRDTPAISFAMHLQFLTEMGAGRLLATWRGASRPLLYYAPLWCDATELTSAVTAGASSIALTNTNRPFFDVPDSGTGYAMLWRSEENAEVVAFTASNSSSLTLSGTVVGNYAIAGTYVVPCRPMWLHLPVNLNWQAGRIASADLQFSDLRPQVAFGYEGASATPTVARVDVFKDTNLPETIDYETFAEAVAYDEADQPIPDATFTWESSNESIFTVTPDLSTKRAVVRVFASSLFEHMTVTSGGISTTESP